MSVIGDLLQQVRDVRYNISAAIYPGYRLTERSRKHWDQHEATKDKADREWAARGEQRKREKVVAQARQMIEQSFTEYALAKAKYRRAKDIKVYTDLTLNWNAERVLSKHKNFKNLCRALEDEQTWRMLNRRERRFIADAVNK